jgi:uncharacterized surface protein with fasciclin (FAS1) repeats
VKSLYHTALEIDGLTTWVAAVDAVGLADLLKMDDYLTVFAPTDEAFEQLPEDCVEDLLGDVGNLQSHLHYHVAPGRILFEEMRRLRSLRTLTKDELMLKEEHGLFVNNARVIAPDIECRNGVIHIVDTVLLMKKHRKVKVGMFYKTGQLPPL